MITAEILDIFTKHFNTLYSIEEELKEYSRAFEMTGNCIMSFRLNNIREDKVKRVILISCAVLALAACDDKRAAERAIRNVGLEPVQVGGYAFWACSEDDMFATRFTARNAQGRVVNGAVCSGWFKGSTIRFD